MNMNMNFFCIILSLPMMLVYGLSNTQLTRINRIIMNPNIDNKSKNLIESVLYKHYEKWAIEIGSKFKKLHYYKCKHIPYYEISIYSQKGLLNAIKCYSPTKESTMFHLFAIHHIRGQLYRGMTDLSPITNVSKKKLLNRGTIYQKAAHNNDMLKQKMISDNNNGYKNKELWEYIEETCDPFTRRCITYKFDYDFNKIRSNLEVSRLMECSEETVRKAIFEILFTKKFGNCLSKMSQVREP